MKKGEKRIIMDDRFSIIYVHSEGTVIRIKNIMDTVVEYTVARKRFYTTTDRCRRYSEPEGQA
jgi:hypothetical protein